MVLKEIKRIILDDYKNGATQKDLAKKYNVTQQYIALLISGKQTADNMALKTFLKMFPAATINLHGSGNVHNNTVSGNGNAVGHSNYVVNNSPSQSCIDSIIEIIINNDELSDEERGKFIRIIKASVRKKTGPEKPGSSKILMTG